MRPSGPCRSAGTRRGRTAAAVSGRPGRAAENVRPPGLRHRAGVTDAAHSCNGQLLVTAGPEVGWGDPAPACRGDAGLQPAQPAVPLLQRYDPRAAGALAAVVAAGEVVAGPAVRLRSVGGSPGQAVRAAGSRGTGDQAGRPPAGGSGPPARRPGGNARPPCAGGPGPWSTAPAGGAVAPPGSTLRP